MVDMMGLNNMYFFVGIVFLKFDGMVLWDFVLNLFLKDYVLSLFNLFKKSNDYYVSF